MRKLIHFTIILSLLMVFEAGYVFGASNLDEGVNELATQISENMLTTEKNKIAVVEFSNLDGTVSAFGQFLAEELITTLFMVSHGKFTVVERSQLQKVFAELGFQMAGMVDEATIKKLGKILGVDAVVTGSITDLGNIVKVNGRMIGTETGRVFAVAATEIPKVGTVADLMAKRIARVQPTGPAKRPETKKEAKVFEYGDLRIVLKSLKKSGNQITSVLVYENIGNKVIKVGANGSEVYLVDESGERWVYKSDTEYICSSPGWYRPFGKQIPPKTKLATKIVFLPKGDPSGTLFSLTMNHRYPEEFSMIMHELVPE